MKQLAERDFWFSASGEHALGGRGARRPRVATATADRPSVGLKEAESPATATIGYTDVVDAGAYSVRLTEGFVEGYCSREAVSAVRFHLSEQSLPVGRN